MNRYFFIPTQVDVVESKTSRTDIIPLTLKTVNVKSIDSRGVTAELSYEDLHTRVFVCDLAPVSGPATKRNKASKRFSRVCDKVRINQELVFRPSDESRGLAVKSATYLLPSHMEKNGTVYIMQKFEATCQGGGLGWYKSDSGQGMVVKSNTTKEGNNWKLLAESVASANILPLTACIRAGSGKKKWYVMAMPQCDMDLWDYIVQGKYKPSLSKAVHIARLVAKALAAVSRSAFKTHGDVKPENIFVQFDPVNGDKFFLGDFDTCEQGGSPASTGTREYYSPDRPVLGLITQKEDVFSFGLVFLSLLHGVIHPTPEEMLGGVAVSYSRVIREATKGHPDLMKLLTAMLSPVGARRWDWAQILPALSKLHSSNLSDYKPSLGPRPTTHRKTEHTKAPSRIPSAAVRKPSVALRRPSALPARTAIDRLASIMHSVVIEDN